MANRNIFSNHPAALVTNKAGGQAYLMTDKAALVQLAMTGTIADTYYESAHEQLTRAVALSEKMDAEFLARLAVFARLQGKMKDMPALLCAVLSQKDTDLFTQVFPQVMDTGRMIRTFVQIVRSGVTGRKSLGSAPKRAVRKWLESSSSLAIINASIGQKPSLADVIRMVHPRPKDRARDALFSMIIEKAGKEAALPEVAKDLLAFQKGESTKIPLVNFQLLTGGRHLASKEWQEIATHASWQTLRMNLATFRRHGAFEGEDGPKVIERLAAKLSDGTEIKRAKALPFQFLAAYKTFDGPQALKDALEQGLEASIENVPPFDRKVVVLTDISGSMSAPVTGRGHARASSITCADAAAMLASIVVRKNRDALVMPFSDRLYPGFEVKADQRVFEVAQAIARLPSGGTDCSLPLRQLNDDRREADLLIYFSDNESWLDPQMSGKTAFRHEWIRFKKRNPNAKLVCVDLAPGNTTPAGSDPDILNLGGFSEELFEVIQDFVHGTSGTIRDVEFLLRKIESFDWHSNATRRSDIET